MCPFRHISGEKTVVCKHWLRGLCKKGDQCEFLHEYDMTKMPECYFYSKFGWLTWRCTKSHRWAQWLCCWSAPSCFLMCVLTLAGECSNKECPFLHIDPESKIKDCPWYDRGFCKHGRSCSVVDTNSPHPLNVLLIHIYCCFECHQQQKTLFSTVHMYYSYISVLNFLSQVPTADTDTQEGWSVWIIWWASVQKENPVNLCSMLPFFIWFPHNRNVSEM